ncbi:MAG: type II toxin-antitoxin system RelE/ParE family toxin [Janthinobacterium lividum]
MIISFKCADTQEIFETGRCRRFATFSSVAYRKLRMLDSAGALRDLRIPPANHLEALIADRIGQHSIRVTGKWRVCFRWTSAGAEDVEIVDYH